MTSNPGDASHDVDAAADPDSPEFLQQQNPVERVNPGKTADEHATDAAAIPTDPTSTSDPS